MSAATNLNISAQVWRAAWTEKTSSNQRQVAERCHSRAATKVRKAMAKTIPPAEKRELFAEACWLSRVVAIAQVARHLTRYARLWPAKSARVRRARPAPFLVA